MNNNTPSVNVINMNSYDIFINKVIDESYDINNMIQLYHETKDKLKEIRDILYKNGINPENFEKLI
jgi:hypothetical protein